MFAAISSVAISLTLLAGFATAATALPITAYVTNLAGNTVTPIDLATNTPGARIPAGQLPAWVAITPDGKTAYVTDAEGDSVTPIDLATNKPGAVIAGPFHFPAFEAITPDGRTDYVTNFAGSSVTPIDLATNTAGAEIKVGAFARGIAITPDGKTAYVANFGSNSLTPIDLATNTPGAEIKVVRPFGIAITPDGKTAYVTKLLERSVMPIDLATNRPGAEIKVGLDPRALAITPNGKTAYATNSGSNTVTPIDLATNTAGAEIKVGVFPEGIAITPDGKIAYVANVKSNSVTPIDLATNRRGTEIDANEEPAGIAITPDHRNHHPAEADRPPGELGDLRKSCAPPFGDVLSLSMPPLLPTRCELPPLSLNATVAQLNACDLGDLALAVGSAGAAHTAQIVSTTTHANQAAIPLGAGLPRITFYGLRHGFGPQAIRTFNIYEVQRMKRPSAHHDHPALPRYAPEPDASAKLSGCSEPLPASRGM